MRTGAVPIIDALGWKGIWKDGSHERVLRVLRELEKATTWQAVQLTKAFADASDGIHKNLEVDVRFLSDTIVVVVGTGESGPSEVRRRMAFVYLGIVVANVLGLAAKSRPSLCYRGAIAVGEYHLERNFLVGRAIDRAAALMDIADAGIVWVDPSAVPADFAGGCMVPYDVPLRDGRTVRSLAVNPFGAMDSDAYEEIAEGIVASFERESADTVSIDVAIKKQHTLRFLEHTRPHAD